MCSADKHLLLHLFILPVYTACLLAAGRCLFPVLPLVWVFIQSSREEEGTWQIYEVCWSSLASWDTLTFTH